MGDESKDIRPIEVVSAENSDGSRDARPQIAVLQGRHGRTMWDVLSEFFESRRGKRGAFNWAKGLLITLVGIIFLFFILFLTVEVSEVKKSLTQIPESVLAIRKSAADSAESVQRIERKFDSSPSVYWWTMNTDLDIVACKAVALETLERTGVKNVNSANPNVVYGKYSSDGQFPSAVQVFCPQPKAAVLVVSDRDEKRAAEVRDKLRDQYLQLANAKSVVK